MFYFYVYFFRFTRTLGNPVPVRLGRVAISGILARSVSVPVVVVVPRNIRSKFDVEVKLGECMSVRVWSEYFNLC